MGTGTGMVSEHPIYDSLCNIYRYQGGWAFEDYGDTWRPWSDAWTELCDAVSSAGWTTEGDRAFEQAKATLRAVLRGKIREMTR